MARRCVRARRSVSSHRISRFQRAQAPRCTRAALIAGVHPLCPSICPWSPTRSLPAHAAALINPQCTKGWEARCVVLESCEPGGLITITKNNVETAFTLDDPDGILTHNDSSRTLSLTEAEAVEDANGVDGPAKSKSR
eukprot:182665-Prymnesium_polylepis.3